jgi:ribosomal protein S25
MKQLTDSVETLLETYRSRIETRGRSVTARVIDALPDHPIVDTTSVAQRYEVTPQTAHAALRRLTEAGILAERTFSRRRKGHPRKAFAPTELIDLLGYQ